MSEQTNSAFSPEATSGCKLLSEQALEEQLSRADLHGIVAVTRHGLKRDIDVTDAVRAVIRELQRLRTAIQNQP